MNTLASATTRSKKIWSELSFGKAEIQSILQLYRKYRDDLLAVKEKQQFFFNQRNRIGLVPQLCDLEAEITYMRMREYRPSTVIEISPASGWSTSWILHALEDNGSGMLYSYDLVNDSTRTIPSQLSEGRWKFHQGDIRNNMQLLPAEAEYLFVDSDHSAEFAYWYIDNLFPLFKKGTKVSVHDILKWPYEPGWGEESLVLCSWLVKNNITCATASRIFGHIAYDAIMKERVELGLGKNIQSANFNSMIFFELQ